MESDQSEHLYAILFDERQESWYVTSGSSRRIPLTRETLQHLVSLYNEIHRGAPLTLIGRRAMEELGNERGELQETIRSLYDYIDAEAEAEAEAQDCRLPVGAAPLTAWGRVGHWLQGLISRRAA